MNITRATIIFCLGNLVPMASVFAVFDTLEELKTYAAQTKEFPAPDNDNLLNPSFRSVHLGEMDNWLSRLWKKKSLWSIEDFKKILEKVTVEREKSKKGLFVEKIVPKPGSRCIIWGDILGASHSLVRTLSKVQELGIIDNNLKIINPNDFFIFNGDVISRGPYNLEVLTTVLKLMEKNPEQVFYVRGTYEHNERWKDYNFKEELMVHTEHILYEKFPVESLVIRFFETLPLALYLQTKDKTNTPCVVRISNFGIYEKGDLLHEDSFADLLLNGVPATSAVIPLKSNQQKASKTHVDVKALIKGAGNSNIYNIADGLAMLEPEKGATTWSLFSSPTSVNQKLFEFYSDAFGILNITPFVDDWVIDFYNRDVRSKSFDFKKTVFNFLRGTEFSSSQAVVKFSEKNPGKSDEIVIGSINDFSKGAFGHGVRLRRGLALRINKANREGELPNNQRIKLVMLDDEYTPALTLHRAEELMDKYKSDIVILTLGAPTHEALLPLIKEKKLLVLFNFAGSMLFRTPDLTYNLHYRASYEREAAAMVEYAINPLNMKRFAIVYQNDSFGKALRNGARAALQKHNRQWVEAHYNRNTLNIDEAAKTVVEFDPEVIMWFGVRTPFFAFVQKVGIVYVSSKLLIGPTMLTDIFRLMIKPRGLDFMVTRVVPDPHGDTEIAREYRAALEKYMPGTELTVDDFEAYINGGLLVEAIKRIKGPVTKETVLEQFHNMKNFNYKGLNLNYDPQTQELVGNKDIWIDTGKEWVYMPKEKTEIGEHQEGWAAKPESIVKAEAQKFDQI